MIDECSRETAVPRPDFAPNSDGTHVPTAALDWRAYFHDLEQFSQGLWLRYIVTVEHGCLTDRRLVRSMTGCHLSGRHHTSRPPTSSLPRFVGQKQVERGRSIF